MRCTAWHGACVPGTAVPVRALLAFMVAFGAQCIMHREQVPRVDSSYPVYGRHRLVPSAVAYCPCAPGDRKPVRHGAFHHTRRQHDLTGGCEP